MTAPDQREEADISHPARDRRRLRIAAVILLLVTAVMVGKALGHDVKDADVWWRAGRCVLAGGSIADINDYRYPPAFAVIVSPLTAAPLPAFALLWYALNVGFFALSLRLASQLLAPGARWSDLPRLWLSALLVAIYAVDNAFLGQTNLLVTALIYLTLRELSRNREGLAGLPLAGAIAVKVFPAPLLGYLAFRLRLLAVASTLLACLVFMLLVPAPVRGFGRNYDETRAWWQRVVEPYLSRGKAGDWGQHALDFGNQSLQAVAHRYLTPVNAYVAARDPRRQLYVNFVDLTPRQVNQVVVALFALLALSFAIACGLQRPTDPLQQATEYSLAVILVLLVSAISWTYFFVMLLLPIATARQLLAQRARLRPASAWLLTAGLLAVALSGPLLVSAYARALGHLFWATVALYLGLAVACRDLRQNPPSAQHQ